MTDLTTPAQIVTVTSSQGDVLWSGPASSDESAWRQACTAAGYDRPEDEPELCGTPADYTYEREPANISLAEYLSRPNVIVSLTLATGSEDDCSWIDGETEFFVVAVESDDAQGTSGPFYFYFGDYQLVFDSKEAAEGTSSFLAACDIFGPDGDQYLQDVGARYVVHGPMSADQVRSEYESHCTQRCGSDVKI